MIVTPEGLNVFPEDVERVLNRIGGVRESAVVGVAVGGAERVHAVLVLAPGTDVDAVVREANHELADHQKIRRALVWPESELPRTEGTRKLKRTAIAEWVASGQAPSLAAPTTDRMSALVAKSMKNNGNAANKNNWPASWPAIETPLGESLRSVVDAMSHWGKMFNEGGLEREALGLHIAQPAPAQRKSVTQQGRS